MTGAPCWPTAQSTYDKARVYERVTPKQTDTDAVAANHLLTKKTAIARLASDVDAILGVLTSEDGQRTEQTRIVVTYGCPSEEHSIEVRKSPFAATVSLGKKSTYTAFDSRVDIWIHGAPADKIVYKMGKVICRTNPLDTRTRIFAAAPDHLFFDAGFGKQ